MMGRRTTTVEDYTEINGRYITVKRVEGHSDGTYYQLIRESTSDGRSRSTLELKEDEMKAMFAILQDMLMDNSAGNDWAVYDIPVMHSGVNGRQVSLTRILKSMGLFDEEKLRIAIQKKGRGCYAKEGEE